MDVAICKEEGVVEFFKDLVQDAMAHQHVDAPELTSYYVVQLLSSFARSEPQRGSSSRATDATSQDQPLAFRLGQALESGGHRQRQLLREVGDASLFLSGFFPDRLRRSLVDVDYYAALGGYAYGSLAQREDEALAPVFSELSSRFLTFVDVLSEVSERSAMSTPTDLLRLYERWLRTGSRHCGQLLVEQGVVPNSSLFEKSRIVQ
jgi:hypothetical protein